MLTSLMPNVRISLDISPHASFAFPLSEMCETPSREGALHLCELFVTRSGESAYCFCDISHILFRPGVTD